MIGSRVCRLLGRAAVALSPFSGAATGTNPPPPWQRTETREDCASFPTALFAFNAGIEVGQLCFVGLVLGVGYALTAFTTPRLAAARWIPVYAMGSLSALWCIERTLALVAPTW